MRGQMMGGLRLGNTLFSSNPGILSNFQVGKRIQERMQTVRRTANLSPAARTKVGGQKVFVDRTKGVNERFISV